MVLRDISYGGCYLEGAQNCDVGSEVCISLGKGDHAIVGQVVRKSTNGAGVEFTGVAGAAKRELRSLLRSLHARAGNHFVAQAALEDDGGRGVLTDPKDVSELLAQLCSTGSACDAVLAHGIGGWNGALTGFEPLTFSIESASEDLPSQTEGDRVFCSARHNFERAYFEATIVSRSAGALVLSEPSRVVFSERRNSNRVTDRSGGVVNARLRSEAPIGFWALIELGERGCSVSVRRAETFRNGQLLFDLLIRSQKGEVKAPQARVVYVAPRSDSRGVWYRVGLEFLMGSGEPVRSFVPVDSKEGAVSRARSALGYLFEKSRRLLVRSEKLEAEVVRFEAGNGRRLVGLIDTVRASASSQSCRAVVIVPGFAARKETMMALAKTLVWNAKKRGENLLVLRYDGSDNLGESHKSEGYYGDGRDCIAHTVEASVEDLQAAVRLVVEHSPLPANAVDVVSVSFSSVATRHAIAYRLGEFPIRHWVSYMGAADVQNSIMNVSGNFDAWGNYKAGVSSGVQAVQGCMVDADRFCANVDKLRVGTVEDGERDMALIDIPVTWIVGKHDAWMDPVRINRLMRVPAKGERSLIEVNSGHVPKTSEEALQQFKMLDELLAGGDVESTVPPRGRLALESAAEWRRVQTAMPAAADEYWKDYLLGESGQLYDMVGHLSQYREFCAVHASLGEVTSKKVLELGAGTGLVTGALLEAGVESLLSTDLVPGAVSLIRGKFATDFRLQVERLDADTDRYPFEEGGYDVVVASLLLSYLKQPDRCLREARRLLRPGGRIVVSSMLPDADTSPMLKAFLDMLKEDASLAKGLDEARELLNKAAELLRLQEQGSFRFYSVADLTEMLSAAGYQSIRVQNSYGDPPQAIVVTGVTACTPKRTGD